MKVPSQKPSLVAEYAQPGEAWPFTVGWAAIGKSVEIWGTMEKENRINIWQLAK